MESKTLNVLVVIDVQNCFMSNLNEGETFLNMDSSDDSSIKFANATKMVKRIETLCGENNLVCFTRDMHPLNHISFGSDESDKSDVEGRRINLQNTWPTHCRDYELRCDSRINDLNASSNPKIVNEVPKTEFKSLQQTILKIPNGTTNEEIELKTNLSNYSKELGGENLLIKGNELSYYFLGTSIANDIVKLNSLKREQVLALQKSGQTEYLKDTIDSTKPTLYQNKYFSLWKGEKCNQESYSAFNYHIKYTIDNPSEPTRDPSFNSINKANSTGLFEYILSLKESLKYEKIIFTLCGLVGDVCVMHSFLEGMVLYNEVYRDTVKIPCEFKIDLASTAFIGIPPVTTHGFYKADDNEMKNIKDFYILNLPKGYEMYNNKILSNETSIYSNIFKTIGGRRTRRRHCKTCKCLNCCGRHTKKNKNKKSRRKRRKTKT